MRPPNLFHAWVVSVGIWSGITIASAQPADPEGVEMMRAARALIAPYHAGAPPSGAKLRVVYFHPDDRLPLPNHAERLDRVLNDISDYYQAGMRRFGFENAGLPLEKKDGRLVLHPVEGSGPASDYKHESGTRTMEEIAKALAGTVEVRKEYVLAMYGLCRKEPDGRYVFDAPYYGGGTRGRGFCHAADCELLDPLLLKETGKRIVYTEHYYPRMEQSVAKFNSMYLGGTAHELGHGLGLLHDAGGPVEKDFGDSLMGSGNLTYRQETWGGGPAVVLTRASALQLASHPLFTGSDRGRWDDPLGGFETLTFSAQGRALQIRGKATGKIPAYAVVASVWPATARSDHGAVTFPTVLKDGTFSLEISGLAPTSYQMRLSILHANGATTAYSYPFGFNEAKEPDAAAINDEWLIDRAEVAIRRTDSSAGTFVSDDVMVSLKTEAARKKMRVLKNVIQPAQPVDPAIAEGSELYLSDAVWKDAKVGWGKVTRNCFQTGPDAQAGVALELKGEVFEKGLYAHSPSRFLFDIGGKWKNFSAVVGLRDGAAPSQGSAVFRVLGDGKELYRSRILRPGMREDVKLDLTDVRELELLAEGGEGHSHNSWAIWAAPKLAR